VVLARSVVAEAYGTKRDQDLQKRQHACAKRGAATRWCSVITGDCNLQLLKAFFAQVHS
jgi:hypothetical protein